MAKTEIKKITVGLVFSWIFGVLFFLTGLMELLKASALSGILFFVAGAILLPPISKIVKEKMNFELSGWLKIMVVLGLLVIIGFTMQTESSTKISETSDINTIQEPTPIVTETQKVTESPKPMQPIKLTGVGDEATNNFYLASGLRRFKMTHIGDSNFAIWAYDSYGNKVSFLCLTIKSLIIRITIQPN